VQALELRALEKKGTAELQLSAVLMAARMNVTRFTLWTLGFPFTLAAYA